MADSNRVLSGGDEVLALNLVCASSWSGQWDGENITVLLTFALSFLVALTRAELMELFFCCCNGGSCRGCGFAIVSGNSIPCKVCVRASVSCMMCNFDDPAIAHLPPYPCSDRFRCGFPIFPLASVTLAVPVSWQKLCQLNIICGLMRRVVWHHAITDLSMQDGSVWRIGGNIWQYLQRRRRRRRC